MNNHTYGEAISPTWNYIDNETEYAEVNDTSVMVAEPPPEIELQSAIAPEPPEIDPDNASIVPPADSADIAETTSLAPPEYGSGPGMQASEIGVEGIPADKATVPDNTSAPEALPNEQLPAVLKKRRPRGTNPNRDSIWTRHHVLCSLGVIADIMLGGYDSARQTSDALKCLGPLSHMPTRLLAVCQWILNESYLNFQGSSEVAREGLEAYFRKWAANRVYYFFRPGYEEHPAYRTKANLNRVYREFYDTFYISFAESTAIDEAAAQEFWISVADRVPFQLPLRAVVTLAEAKPSIIETGVASE